MRHAGVQETKKTSWRNKMWVIVPVLLLIVIAFVAGWFLKGLSSATTPSQPLRISGYQFIDPLLLCNVNNSNTALEDHSLTSQIQDIINSHQGIGDISKASVYFYEPLSGEWASVNGNDTFFPSSLGKIPILITYYLESESDPSILDKEITYPVGSQDLNDMQDIPPASAIIPGHTYTVEQLLEYMIKYSDNNATALLDDDIDQDTLNEVYGDLGIPVNDNPTLSNLDFITAHQIATMFRVLYNATYLSRADSEKALELMSQSSFTEGIVAGIPAGTPVAHKLGLVGIAPGGVTTEHELHDCGIVYAKDPYVLCVMTRGSAPLPTLESIIAQISKVTYAAVQSGN